MALRKPASKVERPGGMSAREYFETTPESVLPTNLIDGELIVMPSPQPDHQTLALEIAVALRWHARSVGGTVFIAPLDIELSENVVLQPDIFYIAPGSAARIEGHVVGPPDLIVEVLSPSHRRTHERKMENFARYGVREAWVVDGHGRAVSVYRNEGGTWGSPATVAFGEPIPSVIVDVGDANLAQY